MESRISIIINHVINEGMIRSNRLGWFAPQRIVTLILLLVLCIDIQGQSPAQADLLRKAYSKHSKSLLYSFFDNWSDEISSNEFNYALLYMYNSKVRDDRHQLVEFMNHDYRKAAQTGLTIKIDFHELSEEKMDEIVKNNSIEENIDIVLEMLIFNSYYKQPL